MRRPVAALQTAKPRFFQSYLVQRVTSLFFLVIFVAFVAFVRNANLRCRIIANDRFLTKRTKVTKITKQVASKRRLSQTFCPLI